MCPHDCAPLTSHGTPPAAPFFPVGWRGNTTPQGLAQLPAWGQTGEPISAAHPPSGLPFYDDENAEAAHVFSSRPPLLYPLPPTPLAKPHLVSTLGALSQAYGLHQLGRRIHTCRPRKRRRPTAHNAPGGWSRQRRVADLRAALAAERVGGEEGGSTGPRPGGGAPPSTHTPDGRDSAAHPLLTARPQLQCHQGNPDVNGIYVLIWLSGLWQRVGEDATNTSGSPAGNQLPA